MTSETKTATADKYIGAHPPEFPPDEILRIAGTQFGIGGTLRPLWGERDQNVAIHADEGPSHVLKISNLREAPEELDLQLRALRWLERTAPELPVPRLRPTTDGAMTARVTTALGETHTVHCITLLDGAQFGEAASGRAAMEAAGAQAGKASAALAGFFHPSAGHALFWDVRHIGDFAHHAPGIADRALATAVAAEAERFGTRTLPALWHLRAQIIHHDINPSNVLVDPGAPNRMTGLVDFGDMLHGPVALDAAVAALELATASTDMIDAAAAVLAGYDRTMPLEAREIDLIPDLMIARAALGLLIGVTRVENGITSAHDQDYHAMYAPVMDALLSAGRDSLRDSFRAACRFPRHTPPHPVAPSEDSAARTRALLERRYAVLGRGLPLTYDTPLHTEKGAGVWLYDINGRPHLDCYNNVAHVGHCHPHVQRAVSRQAATLNTNARYLFEPVVSYAERLVERMPGDLGVCLFVNSGSEAVDLALRIARTVTGQSGILAIEGAYHGITVESDAISPGNDWGIEAAMNRPHVSVTRPDIEMLMNPDLVRGPYKADMPDAAGLYAADADRAIARLVADGHPPGSFTMDSAFSTHGILDVPDGYISGVAQRVRAAGGLIIADEVQNGFGRSGSAFWGFENHGITPDFVTLGKPIGNGIAVGCVVTRPEILARFSETSEFFSTFGGNPVACTAAGAVLDVIERDGLQANAHETGSYLIAGLRALAEDHPCIGQVRGRGLFVGVDIVSDRTGMVADGARCSAIKNHLRNHGILVSSDGVHGNILKIRPPMIFTRQNADMLIDGMRRAASET